MRNGHTGYAREDNGKFQYLLDAEDDISPGGAVDWIFQIPINAKFETSSEDTLRLNGSEERPVVHRFAVNFAYLKQILHALDFEDSDEIVLEFREQEKAIGVVNAAETEVKGLKNADGRRVGDCTKKALEKSGAFFLLKNIPI